jgi:hypothetical protein
MTLQLEEEEEEEEEEQQQQQSKNLDPRCTLRTNATRVKIREKTGRIFSLVFIIFQRFGHNSH